MASSFVGEGVAVFQARVIASGLKLYAATGMRPNRAYTPTKMLAAAMRITGKSFKRGEYVKAAAALSAWADHEQVIQEAKGNIS